MKNILLKKDDDKTPDKDILYFYLMYKTPDKKRALKVQEVRIYYEGNTQPTIIQSKKEHPAFICLHCTKVEYHNNENGHHYPLCSMCANTEKIFYRYFQLDIYQNDYQLKPEYKPKIDEEFL